MTLTSWSVQLNNLYLYPCLEWAELKLDVGQLEVVAIFITYIAIFISLVYTAASELSFKAIFIVHREWILTHFTLMVLQLSTCSTQQSLNCLNYELILSANFTFSLSPKSKVQRNSLFI